MLVTFYFTIIIIIIIIIDRLVGLDTDHEVAGSIPVTSTNFKCGLGLERGPPSLVRKIGWLFDWEVAHLIKKVYINRIDGA